MKRVVIIQPFLSYGGAETVSAQLAYYLKKKGFRAVVLALYQDKERQPYLADKVDIRFAPKFIGRFLASNKLFLLILGFPFLLLLTIKETRKTSVLNPHNFPSLWVASLVGWIKGSPVIWTCHNLPQTPFTKGIMSFVFNPIIEFFNKFFAKRCKEIIAVSEKVKRKLKQKYQVNAKVLYPAIDFDFWSKGEVESDDKFVLLQVGRLKKEKNQELSIEAFARALEVIEDANLVIVGDGEDEIRLKGFAKKLGVSSKVNFMGYQPPKVLRDFYAAADINLSPAYETEGFNLSPLEALCSGTVSIVASGSGVDEVFSRKEIGIIASPTVDDFTRKIIGASNSEKKVKEMTKRGQRWVRDNLSWEKYSKKFLELV